MKSVFLLYNIKETWHLTVYFSPFQVLIDIYFKGASLSGRRNFWGNISKLGVWIHCEQITAQYGKGTKRCPWKRLQHIKRGERITHSSSLNIQTRSRAPQSWKGWPAGGLKCCQVGIRATMRGCWHPFTPNLKLWWKTLNPLEFQYLNCVIVEAKPNHCTCSLRG